MIKIITLMVLALFLISGCGIFYDPYEGASEEDAAASRTAISKLETRMVVKKLQKLN